MKKTLFAIILAFAAQGALAQALTHDHAAKYFDEIKAAAQSHKQLWGKSLYAPIMLVDPATRHIYANTPDSLGELRQNGKIYEGTLPKAINTSNTAMKWNGTVWAMISLPISNSKEDRVDLLAHELFHRMQPALGFRMGISDNKHLDQKEGRIYLKLELNALKEAVAETSPDVRQKHIQNAILFRAYRHSLYPQADSTENILELNEGIAQYTGEAVSGRSHNDMVGYMLWNIDHITSQPSLIRSFAYLTTPMYGYMLQQTDKYWNRKVNGSTNLTQFFADAFKVKLPSNIAEAVEQNRPQYGADSIIAQETERDNRHRALIAEYKRVLVEDPHLRLPAIGMSVSFNPQNVTSMDELGTVYPTLRVSDQWGILTVEKGALIGPNWECVSVSKPTSYNESQAAGEGWTLSLSNGYTVAKGSDGNYTVEKD